ncbi:MAG: BMP family ABC transporter substrate-binding protein [Lachnospiraceae bacterium]|nr:BMP family ABC transporter substrate-binding protein [Lachnospiraceae bacterium]
MKKIILLILCVATVLSLAACGKEEKEQIKIGLICLHDENSTYDKNFIDAMKQMQKDLGLSDSQIIIKTNVGENEECKNACKDLVDHGCTIIFADSFGHEDFMIEAAKEFKDVQFCHATGVKAHTENLPNYHNAFASIYEGRYAAGVAAGLKLNQMIEEGKITAEQAVMGYVGAFTYAEVISGFTSFYLGAKSVCPSVTMKVQFTGSWYDETGEKEAANALINQGCVLISQHADSMGAPTACETAGVPNVSYNGSTVSACPNTFIVSSRINWAPYYTFVVNCVKEGKEIPYDWCGGFSEGSVELSAVNDKAAAPGTKEKVDAVVADLKAGKIKVFDTSTFTVDGKKLDSYVADLNFDKNYEGDTEIVSDGYVHESEKRSAPGFQLKIDGIEYLNEKYD